MTQREPKKTMCAMCGDYTEHCSCWYEGRKTGVAEGMERAARWLEDAAADPTPWPDYPWATKDSWALWRSILPEAAKAIRAASGREEG